MVELPLPESEKSCLRSIRGVFRDPAEAEQYLYDSWERMQVVLRYLVRIRQRGATKVLELGANPYFLTVLIQRHFDFDLRLANYFGASVSAGVHSDFLEVEGQRIELPYQHFNVETEPFPYESGSFDGVIFCEILEHLLLSGDDPLAEISRILRSGGFIILSTPNAARLANLLQLMKGRNIYPNYSPHGIYGRHNREYTLPEVRGLLQRHSFRVIDSQVRNIYPHPLRSRMIQALRPSVWREHLFFLAQND